MIMRCMYVFVEFFLKSLKPLKKKLLSSMKLSRVDRKSETDKLKFFRPYSRNILPKMISISVDLHRYF